MDEKLKTKILFVISLIIAVVITAVVIFILASQVFVDAGYSYECDIGEFIEFRGRVFGGLPPYNWSWDFDGDGIADSYEQNPIYSYPNYEPSLEYANLTVIDSLGHVNKDTAYVYIDVELKIGDILFLKLKPFVKEIIEEFLGQELPYDIHAAMYIGNDLFIESADYTATIDTNISKELKDKYDLIWNQYDALNLSYEKYNPLPYIRPFAQ
jgi:hypothetical protein